MVPYGGNARSKKSRIIRSAQYDEVAFVRTRGFEVTSVAETLLTLAAETSGSRLVETLDDSLLTGKRLLPDRVGNPLRKAAEYRIVHQWMLCRIRSGECGIYRPPAG
jgi:hypothetical protein